MPPKKRDKESETSKTSKFDHLQADHELFLQAFEKPTQIYRFLRTRNMLSPIFLNRTLSYMKRRMSRSNKSRNGFKVDSLLDKITQKKSTELQLNSLGGYMTLTFLGFYDKSLDDSRDYQVKVETLLLKICHKKRKESSSAIVEVSVGSCSVPLNPSTSEPPAMASAVSISSDTFSPSQGPNVKSYMLMLRVTVTKVSGTSSSNGASTSEITNGDSDEPVTKRLKSSTDHVTNDKWTKLYGSELIVYDKHNRCLLTNGEYDLVLHDATPGGRSATIARSPHKALMAQWETIPSDNDLQGESNPFDIFKIRPLLKLKLSWSQEPTNGLVNRPKLYQQENGVKKDTNKDRTPKPNDKNATKLPFKMKNILLCGRNGERSKAESSDVDGKRQQIIYQFLYNNNSRQQTEACDDLHCPWCSLDCGALYSLLKHLKLCHSRFNFTYFPIPGGARIDVSINELYDGSYTGSPHDLIAGQARGGARAGPQRRAPLTHLVVGRRARPARAPRASLAEFLERPDKDARDAQRPYLTGHNSARRPPAPPLTHLVVGRRARPARAPRASLAEFLERPDKDARDAQRPYLTGHNRSVPAGPPPPPPHAPRGGAPRAPRPRAPRLARRVPRAPRQGRARRAAPLPHGTQQVSARRPPAPPPHAPRGGAPRAPRPRAPRLARRVPRAPRQGRARRAAPLPHGTQQVVPPHDHVPARLPQRAGRRLGGRDGSAVAAPEDDDDDRRVHGRQRGREGADEDVEPPRDEVQLRRRLPDPARVPHVPPDAGARAAREEPVPQLRAAHGVAARLRAAEPRGAVPDGADAQPDAGGQRRRQGPHARRAAGAARALGRRRQVPAARRHRAEAGGRRQAVGRGRVAGRAPQDVGPGGRQSRRRLPQGRAAARARAARAGALPQALVHLRAQGLGVAPARRPPPRQAAHQVKRTTSSTFPNCRLRSAITGTCVFNSVLSV